METLVYTGATNSFTYNQKIGNRFGILKIFLGIKKNSPEKEHTMGRKTGKSFQNDNTDHVEKLKNQEKTKENQEKSTQPRWSSTERGKRKNKRKFSSVKKTRKIS